jgi:hypothetical protein
MGFAFMGFAEFRQRQQDQDMLQALQASNISTGRSFRVTAPTAPIDVGAGTSGASGGPMLEPHEEPLEIGSTASVSGQVVKEESASWRAKVSESTTAATSAAATDAAEREPKVEAPSVLVLSDEDKETLAKVSLFTGGVVSIPVNTATEADLLALAQDLLTAGNNVFGMGVSAQDAVDEAVSTGSLQADIAGIDKEAVVDAVMAAQPHALSPEATAKARADGREFVNKMALGSTYLEMPVPREHYGMSSFLEAVEDLNDLVLGRGE